MAEGAPCRSLRRRRCSWWFWIGRHVRSVCKCTEMQKGKYPVKFQITINRQLTPINLDSHHLKGFKDSTNPDIDIFCGHVLWLSWNGKLRKISQIKRWKPTPLTTPNMPSTPRNVACQNVKKTKNSQRVNKSYSDLKTHRQLSQQRALAVVDGLLVPWRQVRTAGSSST